MTQDQRASGDRSIAEQSHVDKLQPRGSVAARASGGRKIVNEDGSLALSTDEVRMITSGICSVREFLSISDAELDDLQCVYHARLVRSK